MAISADRTSWIAVEYTANQSDTELIAAPGSGYYIKIFQITVTTGGAGTVLFEEDDDTRLSGRHDIAANAGFALHYPHGRDLSDNHSLTLTTTTSTAILAVDVNYVVLKAL